MDGGELLLGAAEVAGQGGGARAGVGANSQAPLTGAGRVGAVVAAEPPGGEGGGEPPAAWASSWAAPAAASASSPRTS